MSEAELFRALQDLMTRYATPSRAQELSLELAVRDRWRVRILAGVTVLLWLAGIAGVLYMIVCFNRFIILYSPLPPEPGTISARIDVEHWRAREEFMAKMELHHSLEACMVAVPLLLLAALSTVWLVFSSRRATLNQINVSLATLSQQLQEMRQGAGQSATRG
jgi:hypothetical protein